VRLVGTIRHPQTLDASAPARGVTSLLRQLTSHVSLPCPQSIYKLYDPNGSMTLQHFIIIFGAVQVLPTLQLSAATLQLVLS
jgi:hypothetical protein